MLIQVVNSGDSDTTVPLRDGSYTTPAHSPIDVLHTASTGVLAANPNRKYALFVNDGANVIYLALGADSAANSGIRLNANGGNYEMSEKMGNLYRGAVKAIALTATTVLLATEGV